MNKVLWTQNCIFYIVIHMKFCPSLVCIIAHLVTCLLRNMSSSKESPHGGKSTPFFKYSLTTMRYIEAAYCLKMYCYISPLFRPNKSTNKSPLSLGWPCLWQFPLSLAFTDQVHKMFTQNSALTNIFGLLTTLHRDVRQGWAGRHKGGGGLIMIAKAVDSFICT